MYVFKHNYLTNEADICDNTIYFIFGRNDE